MNSQFYDSLKNNILFKNTDITSLNLDEVKGRLIRVGEGEIVYREGAPSDIIYLVVSGQINIIKKKVLGKAKSYIFNENEFFGNDEFIEEITRTSTAVALIDTYLILLSSDEINNLIMQDNEIYLVLRENLSGLFDNSTEITVDEAAQSDIESTHEIDKIITGEEIQTGLNEYHYEENSEPPLMNITEKIFDPKVLAAAAEVENSFETNRTALAEDSAYSVENTPAAGHTDNAELYQEEITEIESEETDLINDEEFDTSFAAPETEIIIPDVKVEEGAAETISIDDFVHEESVIEPPAAGQIITPEEEDEIQIKINTDNGNIEKENTNLPVLSDDETGGDMNKEEVKKIIKAMELVNSTVKIDDLLTSIVNVATDLTNSDRGTLYLVDKEKGELWSKIAMGTEPKEIRLKIGEGIAGNVAKTKIIENIKDVTKHPMFKKEIDKSSGYITKNMLCFPLKNKEEEVIGVLQLLNSKNGEFTDNDEEVLSMISINTAIALQNAELVEKLLTAERVSSLGKMTNFLIQDIKKPVLVSKRYTEHLKSKNLPAEVTQLVDMILTELTQVADLVQTTSSYAEGKTILRTTITGINAALQDFITRTEQFVLSRHCRINFEPDKEINVKIDTKEFFQCFQHLVKNACDAMPDGGALTIKTVIMDKSVKLIFSDQGLGIPESFIDKIFEPFMTHGKKEGSGLGLSITRKIIEAHQGTIEVKSSLGAGAVFTVTLPAGSSL